MPDTPSFARLAPGFDFLQDLVKNAGAALPHIGQWVAPTLDPEEIAKRIEELRTVQFWLEQNARMLGATIQALEVQRMTLSTLKTMNVRMDDLREGLSIHPATGGGGAAGAAGKSATPRARNPGASAGASPAEIDPMQWWGALTKQFTELAASAVKDTAKTTAFDAAKAMAGSAVQQGLGVAGKTLKKAAAAPAAGARQAAAPRRKPRAGSGSP
jgi:hypothetical protein